MTHILLTNDDGYQSPGLAALREALTPLGRVSVLAPDSNRSGVARGITTHEPLHVQDVRLADGADGLATDGTPVDCVRIAAMGLLGDPPDIVVSGANIGPNLGDDVTYSGTVAAALEGVLLGLPAIAVSQEARRDTPPREVPRYDYTAVVRAAVGLVRLLADGAVPPGTLLNVNGPGIPAVEVSDVRATRLGQRTLHGRLALQWQREGRARYTIEQDASFRPDVGTDFWAVERGEISVTPLHFDLNAASYIDALERLPLGDLLSGGSDDGPERLRTTG